MAEYIDREALEKALTVAAANDKDKNRRVWARAICVLHDIPAADIDRPTKSQFKRMAAQMDYVPVEHGRWIATHDDFCSCSYGI